MSTTVTLTDRDAAWLDDLVERGEHANRQAALDAALKVQREAWVRETLGRMMDEARASGVSDKSFDQIAEEVFAQWRRREAG